VRNSQQNSQCERTRKTRQRNTHSKLTARTSKKKLRGRLDSHIAKTARQRVHDDERGSADELLSVDWPGQSNSMLGGHTTAMTLSNRFLTAVLLTQVAWVWACSSHSTHSSEPAPVPTGIPSLSGLDDATRQSIELACVAQNTQGPVAYGSCLNKQINALRSSPGIPSLSGLDDATRQSIELACVAQNTQGPVAYGKCLRAQLRSIGIQPR
jgi:hypothetical protein